MTDENRLALSAGEKIQDYVIEKVLGSGGFAIVYKAKHQYLKNKFVAIKEFLPSHIATREGRTVHSIETSKHIDFEEGIEQFVHEAEKLIDFKTHPHIVNCIGFTKANGTAYLIMDYEDGYPLSSIIKSKAAKKTKLDQQQIIHLMQPIIDGLAYIHSLNVLHRDIKPENVFIRNESTEPVLIDFGVAKQDFSRKTRSTKPAYTPGFAPFEQVSETGDLGPWTDIYALGMMMWVMVTHKNAADYESTRRAMAALKRQPDPLPSAVSQGQGQYDEEFLAIIDRCVRIDEEQRFQSMEELYNALNDIGKVTPSPSLSEDDVEQDTSQEDDEEPDISQENQESHQKKYEPPVPEKGRDITYTVTLTAKEAKKGGSKKIEYNRAEPCEKCAPYFTSDCSYCNNTRRVMNKVNLQLTYPAYTKNQERVKLKAKGDAGKYRGDYGDLYLVYQVEPEPKMPLWKKVFIAFFLLGSLGRFIGYINDDDSEPRQTSTTQNKSNQTLVASKNDVNPKQETKPTEVVKKEEPQWKVSSLTYDAEKLPSGIIKKVTQNGTKRVPSSSQKFHTENYIIRDSNGKILDSQSEFNPLLDPVSFNTKGFSQALSSMTEGETAYFFIPSELAWGKAGTESIRGNTDVYLTIEKPIILDKSPVPAKQHDYVTFYKDVKSKAFEEYTKRRDFKEILYKDSKTGIYENVIDAGEPNLAANENSKITTKYTIRYLDNETIFEDEEDDAKLYSKKLDAGFWLMLIGAHKGKKAEAVIPHYLFGESINGDKISNKYKEKDVLINYHVQDIEDGTKLYSKKHTTE